MRTFFQTLLFSLVLTATGAAEERAFKYDLYLSVKLGGQDQVMGSRSQGESGLYRSEDRRSVGHLGPHHVWMYALATDPHEPLRMFVAAMDGVLRTQDLGRTWRIMTSWDMTEPKSIACDPNAKGHLYAGLPDGIAVSRDGGQTWARENDGIRRAYTQTITIDRTHAGRVLAGTEKGIFLTEDGAQTWALKQATKQTTYDLRQSPHAANVFFAVTAADGAWWSEDRGETWRPVPGVPSQHTLHNCNFDVHDARRLVLCGWGAGVLVSEDGGKTWSDRTAGLPRREIWRVATDPDIPNRLYASPYTEAVYASDDFGKTWRPWAFRHAIVLDLIFVPRK